MKLMQANRSEIRTPRWRITVLLLAVSAGVAGVVGADEAAKGRHVGKTRHNLAGDGNGGRVCVFCHTPHRAGGGNALWNREQGATVYQIYRSSTLDAAPQQPTGASKMCLSCHDGTIALGQVLRGGKATWQMRDERLSTNSANLGTDLSDDHPVSFRYTPSLAATDQQLKSPALLPPSMRLDGNSELQCTTCHDPHDDRNGAFLTMPTAEGELCNACHQMEGWQNSAHATATNVIHQAALHGSPHTTVAENACRNCHRVHAAGGKERLLLFEQEEMNCLSCHDGKTAEDDIAAQLRKRSGHDPVRTTGEHDPRDDHQGARHAECEDCHNPHSVASEFSGSGARVVGRTMRGVSGVTAAGANTPLARHEYEVCFRCHGDGADSSEDAMARQLESSNMRLNFASDGHSWHPVVAETRDTDVISMLPGHERRKVIHCMDCHNSDDGPRSGGSGADGPHGSRYAHLLARRYDSRDGTVESRDAYALCYSCHSRASILNDESFPHHRKHVVEQRTPCTVCHDPHGIPRSPASESDHTHLVNFATKIVRPEPTGNRLQFRDLGRFAGSCTLSCHGENHVDRSYSQ
jgi:predicted CXXCH cytochrome family protein